MNVVAIGLGGWWPEMARVRAETVVAVNVGGCLIPAGLAAYEVVQLVGTAALLLLAGAALVNVVVCYRLAQPVQGVGISCPVWLLP
jgi:uncharacterized membrane protein